MSEDCWLGNAMLEAKFSLYEEVFLGVLHASIYYGQGADDAARVKIGKVDMFHPEWRNREGFSMRGVNLSYDYLVKAAVEIQAGKAPEGLDKRLMDRYSIEIKEIHKRRS